MDVGWQDTNNRRLILLELKGREIWQEFDKSGHTAHQHLVISMKGKVTDALLMLAATWVETEIGKELKSSLPIYLHQYQGDGNLKIHRSH